MATRDRWSLTDAQIERRKQNPAADASMFNSNVTPKAKPVEDKPSWSRRSPDQNVFW